MINVRRQATAYAMTLQERIKGTPARAVMLALGGCLTLSSIMLLGDGFGHLDFFLPLAALNATVGSFASERVARVVLAIEGVFILGVLGYQFAQIRELFPHT